MPENKSIELTQSQVKALNDGASALIVPIENVSKQSWHTTEDEFKWVVEAMKNHFNGNIQAVAYSDRATELDKLIKKYSPLQTGDKDILIILNNWKTKTGYGSLLLKDKIEEVLNVRVTRIWELTDIECDNLSNFEYREKSFDDWYNNHIEELEEKHYQETNEKIDMPKYKDNPYLFLYEIKKTEKE